MLIFLRVSLFCSCPDTAYVTVFCAARDVYRRHADLYSSSYRPFCASGTCSAAVADWSVSSPSTESSRRATGLPSPGILATGASRPADTACLPPTGSVTCDAADRRRSGAAANKRWSGGASPEARATTRPQPVRGALRTLVASTSQRRCSGRGHPSERGGGIHCR